MSEALIKSIQDMLNEEKWTRATITNYTQKKLMELARVVEVAKGQNCIDDVLELCSEHLAHSKNSIIALYLSGMLSLKKRVLDDSNLVSLVNIFIDNHKTDIVINLCETIISEDENNKFALRTLAEAYKETESDKIWAIYETLVRIDVEEADIVKLLAEKYEKDGDFDRAIDFYKKALLRYVNKSQMNQIKEIWAKLIAEIPEEIDFYYLVQRKIAKNISEEKSALLLLDLYEYYKKTENWNIAIDILKIILSYDERDDKARKEIVECYKAKYASHSQLEECIRVSSIGNRYRNVFEAIADFEKHIAFDTKNYVFHRSWGVGIIRKVANNEVTIYFGKKKDATGKIVDLTKKMTLQMAVSALQPLSKDHIWVLKATKTKADLVKLIRDDKVWALKTIIKSFDNNCDLKKIKAELVPSVLTASEWTSWSSSARKILDSDSSFGINPNDISMYTVRDRAISQEEKYANEFKAQKNFFSRIDILMRYAQDADVSSEYFTEMFAYFSGYLDSFSQVTEQTIAAFLVVRRLEMTFSHLSYKCKYTFEQLFREIENPSELYISLKDTKNTFLRKDFLICVKDLLSDWAEIYIELFPTVLQKDMLDKLVIAGKENLLSQFAQKCFENYREYRETVIFLFKEEQDADWFTSLDLSYEKQVITLIHILDILYKEIASHCNTTENKKIERQIHQLLFKDDILLNYILKSDSDVITRIYTLVNDVKDLDPSIKLRMRNKILEKYPNFKFYGGTEEKTVTTEDVLWVTSKMFELKQREQEHLTKVEIPANAKEIGDARELGDLKENAEYHAAKEKQKELTARMKRLQEEFAKAKVFDPTSVTTSVVSFGTSITVMNLDTNAEESYTILGPWESNPKEGIISYKTPLGKGFLNAKEGQKLEFKINETNRHYKILAIKKAIV